MADTTTPQLLPYDAVDEIGIPGVRMKTVRAHAVDCDARRPGGECSCVPRLVKVKRERAAQFDDGER